jgi:hypothetical protein
MTPLVPLMSMVTRLCIRLLSRPVILSAAASRIILPGGRTPLVITLSGWGWITAAPAGIPPRWHEWHFFTSGQLQVLLPVARPARILTRNCFGKSEEFWYPAASTRQEAPVVPALKQRFTAGGQIRLPQCNKLRLPSVRNILFVCPPSRLAAPVFALANGPTLARMNPVHFAVPPVPSGIRCALSDAGAHTQQAAAEINEAVIALARYDEQ